MIRPPLEVGELYHEDGDFGDGVMVVTAGHSHDDLAGAIADAEKELGTVAFNVTEGWARAHITTVGCRISACWCILESDVGEVGGIDWRTKKPTRGDVASWTPAFLLREHP